MHAVRATMEANKTLLAVQYKHDVDLRDPKVLGNIMMLEKWNAKPLRSDTFDDVLHLILDNMKKVTAESSFIGTLF
jgi:hypothetical protein